MSDRRSHISSVMIGSISVAFGVAASILTNVYFSLEQQDSTPTKTIDKDRNKRLSKEIRIVQKLDDMRIKTVESRLNALEQRNEKDRERLERFENESTSVTSELPPLEDENQMLSERFASLEKNFIQDIEDPDWSAQASHFLTEGLRTPAENDGFSIVQVECRSELCRATVEFANYTEGQAKALDLARLSFPGLNCVQHIWANDPIDQSLPYQTQLYLDCSKLRNGEVEPL